MILKVSRLGHPVLRQRARDLRPDEIKSPEMKRFVKDMVDTMREYDGVGLAAPQVHESIRVVVMEIAENPRYPEAPSMPLTVLFNLQVEPIGSETIDGWEGCLSIPDFRGVVPRAAKIRATGLDENAKPVDVEVEGFPARVYQHEFAHLEGRVYLDYMRDMKSLSFLHEWEKFVLATEE